MVLDAGADDYFTKPLNVSLFEVRLAVAEQRVRNMREKERTRLALEAKTRELEALFQNLDEVFFSVDLTQDELIQVSPAVRELLGVPPSALMGDRGGWKVFLLPPELAEAADLPQLLTSSTDLTFEYETIRPDGESRWVKSALKPGFSPNGDLIRLDGILSDLTARRVVEQELSARNQELLTLYRVSEITLTTPDPKRAFQAVLKEVKEATGFPMGFLEQLDRENDRLVMIEAEGLDLPGEKPVETPLHQSLAGIAVENRKPLAVEDARDHPRFRSDFLRRQNLRSYVGFPLVASGQVHGVLSLADSKVREIPLRLLRWGESLANSLALFVERVEAEAALTAGEKGARALAAQLQAANQELEAFAYSVSHDLRAPLRTMQGFAHALIQEHGSGLPPQARDFVDRIVASGRQSEDLIRDLLAYSRMTFEELELQEVDLGQVVTDAREQVAADLAERGATLDLPETLPVVVAHHTTLVQILANLLSNAVKFVPEDQAPTIILGCEERESEDRVHLWVEDNGVGIPEEDKERVFKVFERLDGELERPGTGIGLAIVRRGVQRIGGEVGVESKPGKGSRFWLDLPKSQARNWNPWGGRRTRGGAEG